MLRTLIDAGAAVNATSATGQTALMLACSEGGPDTVYGELAELGIRAKASPGRYLDLARILVDHGADVNTHTKTGHRPLMIASEVGNAAIAKLLSGRGADLNARTDEGTTALMIASAHGHASVVDVLLENGAEVNLRNEDKITALHLACEAGHLAASRRLLQGGADTTAQDRYGKTPSEIASVRGHSNVQMLFSRRVSRPADATL